MLVITKHPLSCYSFNTGLEHNSDFFFLIASLFQHTQTGGKPNTAMDTNEIEVIIQAIAFPSIIKAPQQYLICPVQTVIVSQRGKHLTAGHMQQTLEYNTYNENIAWRATSASSICHSLSVCDNDYCYFIQRLIDWLIDHRLLIAIHVQTKQKCVSSYETQVVMATCVFRWPYHWQIIDTYPIYLHMQGFYGWEHPEKVKVFENLFSRLGNVWEVKRYPQSHGNFIVNKSS